VVLIIAPSFHVLVVGCIVLPTVAGAWARQ
jgi:hypothetical protein